MGRGSGRRGARRHQAMVAIGSFAPARVRSDSGNKRPGQLQWRERKEGESSRGDGVSRQREFTVRPLMEDRGGSGHQRHHVGKRAPAPFIGGLGRSVRTTSRPRACCGMGGSMASCAGRVRWRCEWADGAACVHAWRAKSGGGRRWERCPTLLRSPRGAREVSTSVPGPRRRCTPGARSRVPARSGVSSIQLSTV
jgi:hypothetical protein